MSRKHEYWIDDVKVIACMLVLLGHLLQSMSADRIIPTEGFFAWFNQTIYYFHVPLFFICSGYLYQKYSRVEDSKNWIRNVKKKLIVLGIPYISFTIVVWGIKTVLTGAGHNKVDGLFETLVVRPTAPYWYLYALLFLFVITGTFKNKLHGFLGLMIAILMKIIATLRIYVFPYAISVVLENEIWFVFGMILAMLHIPDKLKKTFPFLLMGVIFIVGSVWIVELQVSFVGLQFLMGILACTSIVGVCITIEKKKPQSNIMKFLGRYTMPIFLMHSIFAATIRIILLKLGIMSAWIHIPIGIIVSIIGPIVAAMIMEKTRFLEIFLYPNKFIKID